MKKPLLIACIIATGCVSKQPVPPPPPMPQGSGASQTMNTSRQSLAAILPTRNIRFVWDYPTNELSGVQVFKMYESPDITIALTNWNHVATVIGSELTVSIPVVPGAHFFYCTASNFWGESIPSSKINTPAIARDINSLRSTLTGIPADE